jgi:DNA-binding CsgD family transcriptional regulator
MEAILADRGWASEADRARWAAGYIDSGEFRQSSGFCRLSELFGRLFVRSREQFVSDAEWYASAEFNEYHRQSGIDDFLAAVAPMTGASVLAVTSSRALHSPRFESRERRLGRIFFRELGRHFGVNLLLRPGQDVEILPPRLRQTLECLLDGDSEKQVALRLGLSRHTVHDYVKALYRHFEVSSRGELMARHVRDRHDGRR